ncbi:MAG: metallophosphoesterase family protein [Myxococcales bacterium]|nr:metallophosphoesterase family protein [Myxococcales bacterium]
MRIAIFSDVHSNLEALEAVLRAYDRERIDKIICLGDTVGYGADPQACSERVRSIASVTIVGNHDAAVAGRMDYSYYYEAARNALDMHQSLLTEENLKWLRTLPYEHREQGLAFCHGSPVNLEEFEYIFALDQARQLLPVFDDLARVTFIGHSHLCKAFAIGPTEVHEVVATHFQIRENYKYIISVGSVGQPRDYDPRASYTIFDTDEMTFEFKRQEYDIEKAASKIFDTDLERNFGNRLFLGV